MGTPSYRGLRRSRFSGSVLLVPGLLAVSCSALLLAGQAFAEEAPKDARPPASAETNSIPGTSTLPPLSAPLGSSEVVENPSLKVEVRLAIEKAHKFLTEKQNAEGWWSSKDYPAITALVLQGYLYEPTNELRKKLPPHVAKGYDYILSCVKEDGGIYGKALGNYNTSISICALVAADDPKYNKAILDGRNYIIGQQSPKQVAGGAHDPWAGGVGYGSHGPHSDLSNTTFALEALYRSRYVLKGAEKSGAKELDYDAAIDFLSRCQNLTAYNKEPWASDDAANKGGFTYSPVESKAGEMEVGEGKKGLRSYGSMTYAGLMSFLHADMKKDDPRIVSAVEWLRRNYSVKENPNMGAQGLYYYYFTLTKSLSLANIDVLEMPDGKKVNWRHDLAKELLNTQKADGSWANEKGRWMESDPVLVTSYVILVLEMIERRL
ncbi:MAG: prenyltransferase/squalene oxidase repeat-containing protein [Candidatus Methylacidiphilales bacterium]|nr:prenyltransferase/squalene oxidase repeat-containing protein [Candidatus Methylacidiphilales bacterium]